MIGLEFSTSVEHSNEIISRRHSHAPMALGILAAATLIDHGMSRLEKRRGDSRAQMESHYHGDERSIITIPGCRSDGLQLGQMLEPQFSQFGSTHFIAYPKRDFSLDSVKERLLEARKKDDYAPATVYAISMGGMVLSTLLADEQFREEFGPIDSIILDSSPSHESDLRSKARLAMGAAAVLKSSWSASKIASYATYLDSLKKIEHEPIVTDQQVAEHLISTAHTPLHVAHQQTEFIRNADLKHMNLSNTAPNIDYIQSPYDHVVDTEQAVRTYSDVYQTNIRTVIDESRPYGSHASGPEFQSGLMQLLGKRSDDIQSYIAA